MKTILVTAYAVNPYKGSEEGTGWNLVCQVARYQNVIAVTRKNNRGDIEKYMQASPQVHFSRIQFLYFDLPKWMIFWKKGPLLSALYFYMWQFFGALWLKRKKLSFDIAHSVNFHSNWTPSFLWMLGKPFVWGPVGNHALIPVQYIKSVYGTTAWLKDRMLWSVKWCFWNLDPWLAICRHKAVKVFCVNTQAGKKLKLPAHKMIFMPAVASEKPGEVNRNIKEQFSVLSVGRFVPLKGFDLAIRSFAKFYKNLQPQDRAKTNLLIIGKGPDEALLKNIIAQEHLQHAIEIKEWMPRSEVIKQFRQSSVYHFPSHEGAGMVVAEALSYGLPVVCLDNYGPGEYVHPASEIKVAHASYDETVNGLAASLHKLFCIKELYAYESSLALEQYEKQFQWDVKGEVFRDVYNSITAVDNINSIQKISIA
jgi:glycosyltransferase involved in cell wall biosynthesis